jgi:hypothetical protein
MNQNGYIQKIVYERTKEKFTLCTPRLKSNELTWDCVKRIVGNFPFSTVAADYVEPQKVCIVDESIVSRILECFSGEMADTHLIFAQNVSVAANIVGIFATFCYKKQTKREATRTAVKFQKDLVNSFRKLSNSSRDMRQLFVKQLVIDSLKKEYTEQYDLNMISERVCDYMPDYFNKLYNSAKNIDIEEIVEAYGSKPQRTHIDCLNAFLQASIQSYHLCFDEIPTATVVTTEGNKKDKFITIVEAFADLGLLKKSYDEDLGQDSLEKWVKSSISDYKKSLG